MGPIKPLDPAMGPRPSIAGLDGFFQSYCPPYYPDMGSAVQAIFDAKWGKSGIYKEEGGPVALKDRQSLDRLVAKTPDWCLEATKAFCEYIWETYGRFPATIDPMAMNIWFQAHHLETGFYDEYYQPGAHHQAIKDHMGTWHGSAERIQAGLSDRRLSTCRTPGIRATSRITSSASRSDDADP